jgi:3-oxoacyl-[acyl-carrier-protein] synthase-3
MAKRTAVITAMGKYVPERVLTNKELEQLVDTNDEWIVSRTGIKERRIAPDGTGSSDLAVGAFKDMQRRFGTKAEDIELIIFTTVTPDMSFPMASSLLQHKIGAKNAWGYDLNAACSSFVFGLEMARNSIESGNVKNVLLVGADKMSAIVDYEDRNTCVLFGDAAAVMLLEADETGEYGVIDSELHLDGSGGEFLHMPAGGSLKPATHETIDNKEHYIKQDGKTVFKFAVKGMADVAESVVKKNGLTGDDIQLLVPHQANIRIIESAARRLKLSMDKVMINIDKYGNTTAATIPLALIEAWEEGKISKGGNIVFSTFGAGFSWGATLIKWGMEAQ